MRTLARFLSLLLCLELIVSPIAPNMSLIAQNAYAENCPTGFTFDSTLNRCLTKTETANVMNATMACGSDVQCYKQNAQQALQDKVNSGEAPEAKTGGGFVSTVGQAAAIAVPLALAVGGTKSIMSDCASTSLWAMIAGSAALFVGENLANMQHKSRLKKIRESWGKIVNPENANGDKDKERSTSIEAQSEAFEKLAEAEDSMEKAAKMKKTFFTIAALAYTASAALAVYEHFQYTTMLAYPPTAAAAVKIYTCTPRSTTYLRSKPSLYVEYLKGKTDLDITQQSQFDYNLSASTDIVSFILNKKASTLQNSSPSIEEYEVLAKDMKGSDFEKDKSLFQDFKTFSMAVIKELKPINTAHAVEEVAQQAPDDSATGTSSASSSNPSTSSGVNTNAAKMFKEDEGKGINFMGIGLGVAAGVGVGMMMKDKVVLPLGRAALAGVLAGWTMIMRNHAGSQAEAAHKRAELLRKMKDEFKTASGAIYSCQSEDRNDPAKPNCYCYTSENQRNSSRGNSQICQKLWAGINTKAGSYTAGTQSSRVCVNQNKQADATCACRSTNTCMKVSLSGVKGLNAGTMSIIGNSLVPLNKVADGSIDGANLDAATLGSQAAKMSDLLKKVESSKDGLKAKKAKDKLTKDITASLNKSALGISSSPALGSSGSGMPSNAGDAARMLEKEVAEPAPATGVSGGETIATGSEPSPEQPLEFGMTGDQLAAQEGQLAEAMKQDLDYGGNDINQGSKTNIFEVLSNRYQRSGMRRLFDEKGETKPEAAAKTDITQ